ncbi:hypothetical protein BDP81DRAFT_388208 [Colletotrichum phormii]|uniref:Uncharacterized protein n=1 Tax=Colletotrichum phormii TaxID=359342 RepID=A0AAJ0EJG1_9PEZI|nr:uncharacterized protein BDP81DRAFT_388208 [Colletotrichum phormii]KAK1655260.1 hypothetical protein BDP81DRAFT_388208 [Colletotrichum phormii]
MAGIPSLPLNVFGAQHKQVLADGTDYLADVKVRLKVVRGGFDDTATDLGFARDEPITFNGLDDLTRVETVAAFNEQAAAYEQNKRRVGKLGEATRSMWKELPLKGDDDDLLGGAIPMEIIIEISAFAYPYIKELDKAKDLSDEDRDQIRSVNLRSTQSLFERLEGNAMAAMHGKRKRRPETSESYQSQGENGPVLTEQLRSLVDRLTLASDDAQDAEARHVAEMREKNSEVIKVKGKLTHLEVENSTLSFELCEAQEKATATLKLGSARQRELKIDQDDSKMDQGQSQEDMCNEFKKCVTGLKTQIASLKEHKAVLELRADTAEANLRKEKPKCERNERATEGLKSNIKHLQDSLGTEQQRVMDLLDDNKKVKMKLRELGEDYAHESTLETTNGGKYLDLKSFHDILKSEYAKLEADHKGLVSSHREANSAHGNAIRDMQLRLSKAESTVKDLDLKLKEAHSNHGKVKSAHKNAVKGTEKRLSDDATSHEEAIKEIETRMTDAVSSSHTEATTSLKNSHGVELVNVAQQHEEKVREYDVWFHTASEKLERMRSDLEAERAQHNITVANLQTARAELVTKTTQYDAKVGELRGNVESLQSEVVMGKSDLEERLQTFETRCTSFFFGSVIQGIMSAIVEGDVAANHAETHLWVVNGTWASNKPDYNFDDLGANELLRRLIISVHQEVWLENECIALMRGLTMRLAQAPYVNVRLVSWVIDASRVRVAELPMTGAIPVEAAIWAVSEVFHTRWGVGQVQSHRYLDEARQIAAVDDVDPTYPEYLTLTIPAEDGDYSGECEIVRRQGWPLCVMFNTAKKVCWFVNPDCCKLTLLQWSFRGPSRTITMSWINGTVNMNTFLYSLMHP